MSSKFAQINADAIFDKRLGHHHIRMLAALGYYGGNKFKGCWPSYKKLGKELGIAKRTAMEYIKFLCDLGYVEKVSRVRDDGSQSSNNYRIVFVLDASGEPDEGWLEDDAKGSPHGELPADPPLQVPADPHSEPPPHPKEPYKLEPDKKNHINKSKPKLMTIDQWEESVGAKLSTIMLLSWMQAKSLNPEIIHVLIEEFRIEMVGKGKQYADFRAAFQTYLTKGYLSRTLISCRTINTTTRDGTTIYNRGGGL